jgi:hypothetical protein
MPAKTFDQVLMPSRAGRMLTARAHQLELPSSARREEEQVMHSFIRTRGAASAALRVVLLAAAVMLTAGTSQADRNDGRESGQGERTYSGGGRTHAGDGRSHGGGTRYRSGGSSYGGGAEYRSGGSSYDGGVGYRSGGSSCDGGVRYRSGGGYYGGGRHYSGGYGYRSYRPRTFISFGFGIPYHPRPVYHYYADPYPVAVESHTTIDVTNEPPAGCYYYDRSCDREFSNLDDYTDHLDQQDHEKTIEIIQRNSGDAIRTLEFVGGYWSVEH